jgi:ComF family protein
LKYEGRTELAEPLARYLVAIFQQPPWTELPHRLDACVPVPLHSKRLSERGYNQSALLTASFAQRVELPIKARYLTRTRETVSQVTLSADERRANVAGAFVADPEVAGKRLLVIDDVTTTGATLIACAYALKQAGVAAVYGMALATPWHADPDSPRHLAS